MDIPVLVCIVIGLVVLCLGKDNSSVSTTPLYKKQQHDVSQPIKLPGNLTIPGKLSASYAAVHSFSSVSGREMKTSGHFGVQVNLLSKNISGTVLQIQNLTLIEKLKTQKIFASGRLEIVGNLNIRGSLKSVTVPKSRQGVFLQIGQEFIQPFWRRLHYELATSGSRLHFSFRIPSESVFIKIKGIGAVETLYVNEEVAWFDQRKDLTKMKSFNTLQRAKGPILDIVFLPTVHAESYKNVLYEVSVSMHVS